MPKLLTQQTAEDQVAFTAINIGPRERRRRLLHGIAALAVTMIALCAIIFHHLSPWWRLTLFPGFLLAAYGYFQYRAQT